MRNALTLESESAGPHFAPNAHPSDHPREDDPLRCESYAIGERFDVANATLPLLPPTSGDFHAAFPLEDGTVAVILGDVVGHGPAAAAHADALCRAIGGCLIEGMPPRDALGFVNAAAEMSPEFEGFATAFAGTINPQTGVLVYSCGGHEPALVADPESDDATTAASPAVSLHELDTTGPPLGILDAEQAHYDQHTFRIPDGGTLLLYSDGVTEARRGREMLGVNRLRTLFVRCQALSPMRLARKIIGYARAFSGQGLRLRDDAALLILRRRKSPRQSPSSCG